jgi:hypothetical protein
MVPATVVNYGALTDQYGISVQLRVKQLLYCGIEILFVFSG